VLVVGERAKRGVKRVLLGSVAEGALDYARVPVVIAR
jgi:nucleotide-binding universal stress UspA family protein